MSIPMPPLFFTHSQTCCLLQQLLVFSQIFSKFKGFQLGVYKFVKNDKIFLLESLLLPGLIVIISWEGSRFFSFICSVCQVAFLFEHIFT